MVFKLFLDGLSANACIEIINCHVGVWGEVLCDVMVGRIGGFGGSRPGICGGIGGGVESVEYCRFAAF